MSKSFMVSSLFVALVCVGASGYAAKRFLGKSDDCLGNTKGCLGNSMVRSRSVVGDVMSNWE